MFCDLEMKYYSFYSGLSVEGDGKIEGYASLFNRADQTGDIVEKGAYAASLSALETAGRQVKMLWQHDPTQPIGVWDTVREDAKGLWVSGRLLPDVARAREAQALLTAGAIDGLSIGYRTVKSSRTETGGRRLQQVELWEVSLVTFPMLPTARVAAKSDDMTTTLKSLAQTFEQASQELSHKS